MPDMPSPFDNPLIAAILIGLSIGVVAGLIGSAVPVVARLVPFGGFGAVYVHAYGGIPHFPPAGSAAKVFYTVAIPAAIGAIFDYVRQVKRFETIVVSLSPLILIAWIGFFRFYKGGSVEFYAFIAAASLLGAVVLHQIKRIEDLPPEQNGGPIVAIAVLLALTVGFAPIALVSGSSTGFGLMTGLAASLGGLGLIRLLLAGAGLGWTGLAGTGAVLAACASAALTNGKLDYIALLFLLPAAVSGQVFGKYLLPNAVLPSQLRQVRLRCSSSRRSSSPSRLPIFGTRIAFTLNQRNQRKYSHVS